MAAKSASARRLQPKEESSSPSPSSVASSKIEPRGKRRCVATACIPCRKRKSKCDGTLPKCSTCIAVYNTECSYDPNAIEAAQRKSAPVGVKRSSSAVQEPNSSEYFVQRLLSLPESEAIEAVYQLRTTGDVDAIAEALRKNIKLSENDETPGIESEHAHVKGNVAVDQKIRYGFSSGLGLVPNDDDYNPTKPQHQPTTQLWTDVTTDGALVHHLIKLYFTWSNHFYPIVSEEAFYEDFTHGRTGHCSAILVNAMCAHGSVWTEHPGTRGDPDDPMTSGDRFYQRARELLFEDEASPCLVTVQALQVMSMREASKGHVSLGFRYSGAALTTAIELSMHLDGWKTGVEDDIMRRRSFWAMFNCATAWSICAGRVAILPRGAIEIEKPRGSSTVVQWQLYNDDYREATKETLRMYHEEQMLHQQSSLTELLSEMLVIYYAPRERLSARRILDLYARFRMWYKELPTSLHLTKDATPNIFMLHMWYWSCINHLFRPIVRMKLVGSSVQPREVCIETAIKISHAMDLYRTIYPVHTVNLVFCHVLLTAGLAHVFDLPSRDQRPSSFTEANHRALKDTAQCLRDFATIASVHRFSLRGIQILCGLADKHGLLLQEDVVKQVLPLIARKGDSASTPLDTSQAMNGNHIDLPHHPIKGSGEIPRSTPKQEALHATDSQPTSYIYSHSQEQHHNQQTPYPNQHHHSPHQVHNVSSHSDAPSSLDHENSYPTSLFFTPGEGAIGVPLYHNQPSQSHMDLNVMLGDVDWPEQLRQDGFELSDLWGVDPMAGTNQIAGGRGQEQQRIPYGADERRAFGGGAVAGTYVDGWG